MNQSDFAATAVRMFQIFQSLVPIDTGNLRYNATKLENSGAGTYKIVVSGDVAPYNVYTNEAWISPKWGGKKNPNEGWIDSGVELIAQIIAEQLGGEVRRV